MKEIDWSQYNIQKEAEKVQIESCFNSLENYLKDIDEIVSKIPVKASVYIIEKYLYDITRIIYHARKKKNEIDDILK